MTREDKYTRDVKGYEGRYKVNALGEVFSVKRNIKLSETIDCNGYVKFCLYKDGKRHQVKLHRIVAEAFIPNPLNKREVNHIDGDKKNNAVWNLEWVTSSENRKHGMTQGFVTFNSRKILCKETGRIFERPSLAAEWVKETYPDRINGTMRVAAHNIGSACKGRTPKAYGFTWIYHEGSTTIPTGSRGKRPEMGDPSNEGEDIV